jgi:uncharacterized peroxidase-related enzyme
LPALFVDGEVEVGLQVICLTDVVLEPDGKSVGVRQVRDRGIELLLRRRADRQPGLVLVRVNVVELDGVGPGRPRLGQPRCKLVQDELLRRLGQPGVGVRARDVGVDVQPELVPEPAYGLSEQAATAARVKALVLRVVRAPGFRRPRAVGTIPDRIITTMRSSSPERAGPASSPTSVCARYRAAWYGGSCDQGDDVADSRFPLTELTDLPDDLRERIDVIAQKSGFVPNIFRALGHRPAELRAFLDYHDALMDRQDGLSKAERELVVVAASGANHCTYCVVAHGAILRIRAKDRLLADRVAINPWQAELDDRPRAIVDLALALTRKPELFGEPDLARARAAGLTDDEIWDVGAITAFFAASNRLAHLMALQPNPEFYAMGRDDRR